MSDKLKIYPSSSGFLTDKGLEVEYNSGCLRYMVAAIGTKRVPLDPIYEQLGALHEDWYASQLGENLQDREKEIRFDLSDKVQYSGRADFITKDGHVHETKASLSKSFLYSVIRKKQVKLSHLAQVVSYMIQLKSTKGKIIAGFYRESDLRLQETAEFDIEIDADGAILVNGIITPYTVSQQLAHLYKAQEALETGSLGPRPANHESWSGPCKFCPLNKLCWAKDIKNFSDEEFKDTARSILNAQEPKLRKPAPPKRRRTARTDSNANKSVQGKWPRP